MTQGNIMADLPMAAPTDPNAVMPADAAPVDDGSVTISITRDAEGNYTVEKETPEETTAEAGMMEGSEEEFEAGATKARDLKDALNIVRSMFSEGDDKSAEALFSQGFGSDSASPDLKKPPMM